MTKPFMDVDISEILGQMNELSYVDPVDMEVINLQNTVQLKGRGVLEYSRILPSFNIRQHDVVNNDEVIDIKNEIALDDQAFGYEDDDDYGSRSAIPPGSIFASHGKRIKDGGPTKNQIKNQWVVEGDGKLRNVGRRPRRHQRRPKLPKLPYPYIAVPYPIYP
ncbi:unnamed protein product [Lepeophtheirus salmonis]|uniref:(salmon louse) hypothetical protein n=1 Tax=Lepeophtheirus salmonis TaxID=72036 RepID=A0A7R8HBZ8_LEPSM|nr:unnamed protein product [Lepeophtheirus salmonis]CAF2998362.1 unnamed protein product [Lepeophtheirus salmonis]